MSVLQGKRICILDLETERLFEDLENKRDRPALGLSVGCTYYYQWGKTEFFHVNDLLQLMHHLVVFKPLIVGHNFKDFDGKIMRGIIRRLADEREGQTGWFAPSFAQAGQTWWDCAREICDKFKYLCDSSYDTLQEVWSADPANKRTRGLNGLEALCETNDIGTPGQRKLFNGAMIPKLWEAGETDAVYAHVANDVYLTRKLFELIIENDGVIQRANGPVKLRVPDLSMY